MNGNTSNPPSKYRADLLFWSPAIWGLLWLCGAELDQMAGAGALRRRWQQQQQPQSSSSRAMIGRNWGARVKEEVGNDAGDTCELLEPGPAHCGAGLTVLGHSLVISTLLLSVPCRGRGWREREREKNRAAYWDNNVVYTGDSCKPSATALKPRGATRELSATARLNGEWAYPPAQA